jgi:hypothetical protein
MDDMTRRGALASTVGGAVAASLGVAGSATAQQEKKESQKKKEPPKGVREDDIRHASSAAALITARMAHDPAFAEQFIKVSGGGDQHAARELMTKAGVTSDTEVIVIPGGVCICRGSYCVCVILRPQKA